MIASPKPPSMLLDFPQKSDQFKTLSVLFISNDVLLRRPIFDNVEEDHYFQ